MGRWEDFKHNPLYFPGKNKGMKNTVGKLWDTHIGRKGFIGEAGDILGLWESGTTADKKSRAISSIDKLERGTTERHERKIGLLDMQNANNIYTTNTKTGGIIKNIGNSGNLVTDNNRGNLINKVINDSIKVKNQELFTSMQNKITAQDNHATAMASYDAQRQQIENS